MFALRSLHVSIAIVFIILYLDTVPMLRGSPTHVRRAKAAKRAISVVKDVATLPEYTLYSAKDWLQHCFVKLHWKTQCQNRRSIDDVSAYTRV